MFERFTDRARRVVVLAQEEARMLNHNYIGTEHILLGLIREGEGVAAQVLQKLGADLKRVRRTVIRELSGSPAGRYGEMPSPSPFDEREKIVLSFLIHEGLTTSEIAKLLGVSKEKVGEIVQAVMEKLKDI